VVEVQNNEHEAAKPIRIDEVFESAQLECETTLKNIKASIETNFEINDITFIEPYLLSIFRNILGNAIKYRSEDHTLKFSVSSTKKDEFILLTLKDNGMGMDLVKYGKNLFKPFMRFTSKGEGKGIGLHLVKTMVEKSGGKIEVESYPEKGTTFYISLKEFYK